MTSFRHNSRKLKVCSLKRKTDLKTQAEQEHIFRELKSTYSDFNGIEELAQAKEVLARSLEFSKTEQGRKYVVGFIELLDRKWTPEQIKPFYKVFS